jgi:hypothetical protein
MCNNLRTASTRRRQQLPDNDRNRRKMQTRKKLLITLSALLCASCSYLPPSASVESGSQVGGTGDVGFTHEPLGREKHLVTVTATPGVMETEGSIEQRMLVFSKKFAARTCPNSFDFVNDPNNEQSTATGFMKRTRSFVFVCKG